MELEREAGVMCWQCTFGGSCSSAGAGGGSFNLLRVHELLFTNSVLSGPPFGLCLCGAFFLSALFFLVSML